MKKESQEIISEERLLAYFHQELEGEERKAVENWLSASEEHRKFYRQICRVGLWYRWSQKESLIDETHALKRLRRIKGRRALVRWRYAAAVAVLLVVVGGGWWWHSRNEAPVMVATEVLPGSPKARLLLSTGEYIDLSQDNVAVKEQNGTMVQWDSVGKIRYQPTLQSETPALLRNRIEVPRGGEFQVLLADGTRIWLNADTELEYPVEFADHLREVRLRGEAYFEVQKDSTRPFVVRVGDYSLQVYGTEFNMNTYDTTHLEVVLVRGCIGFKTDELAPEVKMHPCQVGIANLENGETRVFDADVYPYVAWKDNNMVFVNERLESIMQKVERWYDVEVFFADEKLKELRFYGDIKRYAEIRELLLYLERTSRARFQIDGRTIVIHAK